MRARPLLILIAFCPSFAGCVGVGEAGETVGDSTIATRGPAPMNEALAFVAGTNLTIQTEGVGWGRLPFVAYEPLSIRGLVTHPTIDLGARYAPVDEHPYDEHSHTFIYVYLEADVPRNPSALSFQWIGLPDRSQAWTNMYPGSKQALDVPMGVRGVVLVASTVPGYTITLTSGTPSINQTETLALGPVDGYVHEVPEPTKNAIVAEPLARVQYDRLWRAGPVAVEGPSLLFAQRWTIHEGSVYAGIEQDEFGVTSPGATKSPPFPTVGYGGGSGSFEWRWAFVDRATEVSGYRRLVESNVGMMNTTHAGISLIVVPVVPTN